MTEKNLETSEEYQIDLYSKTTKKKEFIANPKDIFLVHLTDNGAKYINSVDGRNFQYIGRTKDGLNYLVAPYFELLSLAEKVGKRGGMIARSVSFDNINNLEDFLPEEFKSNLKSILENRVKSN